MDDGFERDAPPHRLHGRYSPPAGTPVQQLDTEDRWPTFGRRLGRGTRHLRAPSEQDGRPPDSDGTRRRSLPVADCGRRETHICKARVGHSGRALASEFDLPTRDHDGEPGSARQVVTLVGTTSTGLRVYAPGRLGPTPPTKVEYRPVRYSPSAGSDSEHRAQCHASTRTVAARGN